MGNPAELELLEVSCSQLGRGSACPPSLLQVGTRINPKSPEAKLGNGVHELQSFGIEGKPLEAATVANILDLDLDELERVAALAWEDWERMRQEFPEPETEVYHELVDQERGVKLTGHMDLLSRANRRRLKVVDWKSGWAGEVDHWQQLRGYAWLGFDLEPEAEEVYAAVIHVRTGDRDWKVFERSELEAWWDATARGLRKTSRYTTGDHCTYCPRSLDCPAKTALLSQTGEAFLRPALAWSVLSEEQQEALLVKPENWKTLPADPVERAQRYDLLLRYLAFAQKQIDGFRDMVKADLGAHGGSLPTGDGREWALVQQKRTKIDYRMGYGHLLVELTHSGLAECVTVHKGKVEDLISAKYPRGLKKRALHQFYELLREDGALREDVQEQLRCRRMQNQIERANHEQQPDDGAERAEGKSPESDGCSISH